MHEELEKATATNQKLEEQMEALRQESEATRSRMEEQLEQVEKSLDEERKNLVADVSRGKSEVLKLMQVSSAVTGNGYGVRRRCCYCGTKCVSVASAEARRN